MSDDPAHPRFDTGLTKARDMLTREVAVMGRRRLVINCNALTNRYGEILTVAANESSAEIKDIIGGMQPLGPIASSMGIGYDEAAAV